MTEWPPSYQDVFWQAYPRRLDRKKAMAKLEIIRKSGVPFSDIISGVERYVRWLNEGSATVWRPAPKWPTTWLNGACWTDELDSAIDAPRSGESAFVAGVANVAARYGVTAGMGQAGDAPTEPLLILQGAANRRRFEEIFGGHTIEHEPNPPTDRK